MASTSQEPSTCLACGAKDPHARDATIAPFIAKRIWNRHPFRATLYSCRACGLRFIRPGLSRAELALLYRDYRGSDYQRLRERFEPWYTPAFNANLSAAGVIRGRRKALKSLLVTRLGLRPRKVLDFGGNRGELVRELLPQSRAFVYDISGVSPLPPAIRLADIQACAAEDCDLTICSNVLEHVSAPQDMLAEIARAAPNALAFVEVPIESPLALDMLMRRLIQQAILTVLRPNTALALYRLGFWFQAHEHITYFTPEALRRLATRLNYTVVDEGSYKLGGTRLGPFRWRSTVAWVLVKAEGTAV